MVTHKVDIGHNGVISRMAGDGLMPDIPQSGVCTVNAEIQRGELQIRITTYVGTMRRTERSAVRNTVKIAEALDLVEDFLRGFVDSTE
jgi:hypothetical protein